MDEFALIDHYFRRRGGDGVALGVGDDGAILVPPAGREIVVVVDTLVAGVHFPPDTAPADVGWRALAVNLSDIAAMGAEPAWMTLALTLPEADERWLDGFCEGLFELADRYRVALVGGDTTSGPLTVTVQLLGHLPTGTRLLRSGARAGDRVFVSGTLGDAAAGLREAGSQAARDDDRRYLLRRFLRPEPRVELGRALAGRASAAIDVSDGLVADLRHVCESSRVSAEIEVERLPLSPALLAVAGPEEALSLALAGGDDYELCFTLPPGSEPPAEDVTAIGRIGPGDEGRGVRVLEAGRQRPAAAGGYRHFGDGP